MFLWWVQMALWALVPQSRWLSPAGMWLTSVAKWTLFWPATLSVKYPFVHSLLCRTKHSQPPIHPPQARNGPCPRGACRLGRIRANAIKMGWVQWEGRTMSCKTSSEALNSDEEGQGSCFLQEVMHKLPRYWENRSWKLKRRPCSKGQWREKMPTSGPRSPSGW